jgi:phospholipid transport system substrate-binding protein
MRGRTRYRVPMLRRLVAPALLSLALATSASAGEPTETLRRLFDEANRVLLNPEATDDARTTALRALVREVFDAREAAAQALGPEWHARTPAERDEFNRLYADVVETAYLGGFGSRARVHGDGIHVAFESETVQGPYATVVTTLETRGSGAVPVTYRLRRRDGGWAVVDVVVEGLSLASSYRAQFQRVMQNGTYADLVARLREKASTLTLAAVASAKSAVGLAPSKVVPPLAPVAIAPAAEIAPAPVLVASAAPVSDAPAPAAIHLAAIPRPSGAAPASPPSVAVSPERKSFWIQVGAFRDTEAASRVVERLRKHSVMVATEGGRSNPLARVLIGPFLNRAAAATVLKELATGGYPAFIAFE